ncbi:MAG: recombinase family protein [Anaerolineales bacterium]|nr:recombinase family protein [Anaerolineales bacterium]
MDVIVAWREDRLYRGFKPMLEITERIEQKTVIVELVKELFDANLAPVKAWAARQELLAKHDRFMMGFAARLAAGKPWNFTVPYGYQRVNDHYQVEPDEAACVRKIWGWYADGVSVREIRRRLIAAGAPQGDRPRKDVWGLPRIRKLLRYETYHTGVQKVKLEGDVYELSLEPIVDAGTARRVAERRARHKVYPVGNLKYDYLALGLVYCGVCGWRMHTIARQRHLSPEGEYRCPKAFFGYPEPGCVRTVGWHKLDRLLWEKVSDFLADDERFEREVNATIESLRSQEVSAEAEVYRLREQLDTLTVERQKVIMLWRKGKISEEDMDLQMAALKVEEVDIQRVLAEQALLTGNKAQKLIEFAKQYRSEIRAGLAELQAPPKTPEDAKRHFAIKRTAVEALVERIDVMPGRTLRVTFRLDSHSERQMRNPSTGS